MDTLAICSPCQAYRADTDIQQLSAIRAKFRSEHGPPARLLATGEPRIVRRFVPLHDVAVTGIGTGSLAGAPRK